MNYFPTAFNEAISQSVWFDNSVVLTLNLKVGDNISSSQLMCFVYVVIGCIKNKLLNNEIDKNGISKNLHITNVKLNTKRAIKDHNLELLKSLIYTLSCYTNEITDTTTLCIIFRFNNTNNITECSVVKQNSTY